MAKAASKKSQEGLKEYLEKIKAISEWFEEQDEIDLEAALVKIREAGELITLSKERLTQVENEFEEIKADIEKE